MDEAGTDRGSVWDVKRSHVSPEWYCVCLSVLSRILADTSKQVTINCFQTLSYSRFMIISFTINCFHTLSYSRFSAHLRHDQLLVHFPTHVLWSSPSWSTASTLFPTHDSWLSPSRSTNSTLFPTHDSWSSPSRSAASTLTIHDHLRTSFDTV